MLDIVGRLIMRLRWSDDMRGVRHPVIKGVHSSRSKVYLFMATFEGEAFVLEDDATMYPSDTLVAQINLLTAGGK
ncbi:hypothetical protein [Methylocystis heyeri]|uniref:Uncharacterized protein n=1 Tax=Methylocystis heyeri TaxID=391905 RepID=A0A6B8KCI9_9HYPH|nr:hypothetical protein [Methylocystis heyeri]QGM46144.1 hypothetical protein H2LOC_010800 [Methylocystis heyeri]